MDLLTAHQIQFGFNKKTLFSSFNLTLSAGALLHLQGENGAGKTTLLKLLAGLLQPHAGVVTWRDQLNTLYLGTKLALKPELSVRDNILMQQVIAGCEQSIDEKLTALSLTNYVHRPVSELSTGLARRVALTKLVHSNRAVWLLDEPFSGLDVTSLHWLTKTMQQHVELGGAVIFTSHQSIPFTDYPVRELSL